MGVYKIDYVLLRENAERVAQALEEAVRITLSNPRHRTPDLNGKAATAEVGDAVVSALTSK